MEKLIEHYNKFNEDKRLKSRHGEVEFRVSMKYIHRYLNQIRDEYVNKEGCSESVKMSEAEANSQIKILDVGAATGAYSIPLAEEGYEVHAIELVKHNVQRLRAKSDKVHALQGNALKLSKKYEKEYFDLVLIFGPMYHLFTYEDKFKVIEEAKKVTKENGIIMIAYLMEDYALVKHGFIENTIGESVAHKKVDINYNIMSTEDDLYDYSSLETIYKLAEDSGLERINIFTPDGPANYIRNSLREMSEESYELFVGYVEKIAERKDLLGAAGHTVDVLRKK